MDTTTITVRGEAVPALGFGTWQLRGSNCVESVRDALEIGYRHLDTAQVYGNEAEVGEGLRASGVPRDEVFVVSKIDAGHFRRDAALVSTRQSVRRLGTDWVDLMLLHWPNPSVPVREPLEALNELVDEGLVRHIGVSNFSVAQVAEATQHAEIFCNQVECHPYLPQDRLLEQARESDLLLTAYSPVAKGRATRDPVLTEIAERHGRSAAQVALRWLLQRGTAPIPKSADPARRRENLAVFDFSLDDEEMARIGSLAQG